MLTFTLCTQRLGTFIFKQNKLWEEGGMKRRRLVKLKSSDTSPDVASTTLPHTYTQIHSNQTKAAWKHTQLLHTATLATRMTVFIWSRVCFLSRLTVPVDTLSHHDPDWHKRSLKTPPDGECVQIMSSPRKLLSSPLTRNSRWNPSHEFSAQITFWILAPNTH